MSIIGESGEAVSIQSSKALEKESDCGVGGVLGVNGKAGVTGEDGVGSFGGADESEGLGASGILCLDIKGCSGIEL